MDSTTFDSIARTIGIAMSRRAALRGLVFGASAVTAGGALHQAPDAAARRRRRGKNKSKNHGNNHSGSQSCGRHGDGCGALDENDEYTAPYCCHGYECVYHPDNGSWTCEESH